MKRWVILSGTGLAALAGILVWREWTHAHGREIWQAREASLQQAAAKRQAAAAVSMANLAALKSTLEQRDITEQSLRDRIGNLEAQRDHLRTEVERQSERAREAESGIEAAQAEVETARQAMIEQASRPRELESQLEQARRRLAGMEAEMDESVARTANGPSVLTLEGLSKDQSVFALAGNLPSANDLPMPVYLCRNDTILLEGWIHRLEKDAAIGHVKHWREAASKLVKGEKVFILRKLDDERDP